MCEYCGCQEIEAIRQLTEEHDAVVAAISHIRTALDRNQLDAAAHGCRQASVLLQPHMVVEEEGLFPLVAGQFPSHVESLLAEHVAVESVLAEAADDTPADPSWPHRLTEALDLLRAHILKEQDGVFPAALSTLDAAGWDAVDAVRARVGSVASAVRDLENTRPAEPVAGGSGALRSMSG